MSLLIEQDSTVSSPDRVAAVRDLCDAAYGCPTQPFFDSLGPGDHLLGFCDGRLVTHLMWVTRWLQPGNDGPLRTAYVEMVATHPTVQRRGYATALLAALPQQLAGYDVAALCPATEGLYQRLGWRFWRGALFARKNGTPIPTPEERVMILRLPRTPALDLDTPLSVEWRPGEVW